MKKDSTLQCYIYITITLYGFHGYFSNNHNIMDFQMGTQKLVIVHNQ